VKKILIFNDCLKFGGTEALLVDILNHLSHKQCEVTLLLPYRTENNNLLKEVSSKITVEYLHDKPLTGLKRVLFYNILAFIPLLYTKLFLDLKKYDLIVSFKESPYSALFSRSKCSKTLWIHNLPVANKYEIRSFKEWLSVTLQKAKIRGYIKSYARYQDVICVSNACREKFTEIYNKGKTIKNQHIQVLYNAVDLRKIDKLSGESVKFNISPHPVFIMVTRYSVEKRVDRIIKAAHKLISEGYQFKIVILGDGAYASYIEKLISDYSLHNIIERMGYVNNPYPYIKKSDWLVCCSERESFSLVLLESIYLKTPVITTDCGGPTEITENGKYGILAENSTEGVYLGMKTALEQPQRSEFYNSKSDECLKRFDHTKWLHSIEKILKVD